MDWVALVQVGVRVGSGGHGLFCRFGGFAGCVVAWGVVLGWLPLWSPPSCWLLPAWSIPGSRRSLAVAAARGCCLCSWCLPSTSAGAWPPASVLTRSGLASFPPILVRPGSPSPSPYRPGKFVRASLSKSSPLSAVIGVTGLGCFLGNSLELWLLGGWRVWSCKIVCLSGCGWA